MATCQSDRAQKSLVKEIPHEAKVCFRRLMMPAIIPKRCTPALSWAESIVVVSQGQTNSGRKLRENSIIVTGRRMLPRVVTRTREGCVNGG